MNLMPLAARVELDRPIYGIQTHGINEGEVPFATIAEMAAHDVAMIRAHQPSGPYSLWGYSFGARVAFESAYQLERVGEVVENLFLIAPGMPEVRLTRPESDDADETFGDQAYVAVLFSVFAGTLDDPRLDECLKAARDEASFVTFIGENFDGLSPDQIQRITRMVALTYRLRTAPDELASQIVRAPITVFSAAGDGSSFLEDGSGHRDLRALVIKIASGHYSVLRKPGVNLLAEAIRRRLAIQETERNRQCRTS